MALAGRGRAVRFVAKTVENFLQTVETRERQREREQKHTPNNTRHTTAERLWEASPYRTVVGYDLPQISASGVRVGYGWGTDTDHTQALAF